MRTETLHPTPIDPATEANHRVVQGEVITPETEATPFFDDVLNNQSNSQSMEESVSKKRHSVVEGIHPEAIHLYGDVVLADILEARTHLAEIDEAERDEAIDGLSVTMIPESDNKAYIRHRAEVVKLLTVDENRFEKLSSRYEKSQARRDGVKVKQPVANQDEKRTPLTEKLKNIIASEPDQEGENSSHRASTRRELRAELKELDRGYNGMTGFVAETGIKPVELAEHLKTLQKRMEKHSNLDDMEHADAEWAEIRRMIRPLAEAKHFKNEKKSRYEVELTNAFYDYAGLNTEERQEFHKVLDARNAISDELRALDEEQGNEPSFSERLKQSKVALGAASLAVVGLSQDRWNARKVRTASAEDDEHSALSEVDGDKTSEGRSIRIREALSRLNPTDAYAKYRTKRAMRNFDEANMSVEERAATREKRNNRKALVALGAIGLAAAGAYLVYRYGFDPNGGESGRPDGIGAEGTDSLDDLLNIPDGAEDNKPGDNGGGSLSRNELFNGSESTRTLTNANTEHLKDFLSEYKVKAGDDKGVWGISEKYLHSQGIKNPTVFEIDSTKDFILKNSSLNANSVLHPGDTIKIK